MKTFAFVPQAPGPILETYVGDALFEMHPDTACHWYEVPASATTENTWDGTELGLISSAAPSPSWGDFQKKVAARLVENDRVAIRCLKAGVAYPDSWKSYDMQLREFMRASSGNATQSLPTPPAYPSGT